MSISLMVEYEYKWRWVNVRPIAAYMRALKSRFQLGLRFGGHPAPAHIHSGDLSEHWQWPCHRV